MDPLSGLLGAAGFALGLLADRLATRWPEHDEEHPPGRRVDWRTVLAALVGALAFGLLPIRFAGDPLALLLFGAWFVTLVIGLATDLDQRLLPAVAAAVVIPAVLYLPSIPFGAGAFGIGDIKLLIGIGLLVGGSRGLSAAFLALLVSGVVLVVLLAARRIGRRTYVPFGPFFILGALWAVLIR